MNRKEYRERQERDCFNCVHKHPDGNCGSWDCEYINRREAIEAWRAMKGEQIETVIRCKNCKHYNPDDHCYLQGAGENDYCSYGERKDGDSE